jgi:hypothetical protein
MSQRGDVGEDIGKDDEMKIKRLDWKPSPIFLHQKTWQNLTNCPDIMGGELALPDFGIGVIGEEHWSDSIRDDSCLL